MLKHFNPRKYLLLYIIALAIIASLAILSHVFLHYALKNNEGFSSLVNISGRQRMFSQRIVSLAFQYQQGNSSIKPALIRTINRFDTAHKFLVNNVERDQSNSENYKELNQLYNLGNRSLNQNINAFIAQAKQIAQTNHPQAIPFSLLNAIAKEANHPLLNQLDQAVKLFEKESDRRLHTVNVIQWLLLTILLIVLLVEALFLFRPVMIRLIHFTQELLNLVKHDDLTQLLNQTYFIERCQIEQQHSVMKKQPLSFILITIDQMKDINLMHGYRAGNKFLKAFSKLLLQSIQPTDIGGRINGKDFAIVLPNTSPQKAKEVAQHICEKAATHPIQLNKDTQITFTISVGVTALTHDFDSSLALATDAVREAKSSNQNSVMLFTKTD